jgi:hypothetical protein
MAGSRADILEHNGYLLAFSLSRRYIAGMMELFAWIERTSLSVSMREDYSAYFVAQILHAWGMAFLVGGGLVLSLRVLGVASDAPLERFVVVYPVMRVGLALAIPSGSMLLLGYPAKALTNWVFALKFACLGGAAVLAWGLRRKLLVSAVDGLLPPSRTRWMAAVAMLLWIAGVCCGKLLLYTNRMLLAS